MSRERWTSQTDWVCADSRCGYLNYAKRDRCHKCDKRRKNEHSSKRMQEVGKDVADKGRGLFSPDDWNCKNCGNINWARRNTCNVCNTSRTNTLGERTGYGGGYMEREEVVQYKRRSDRVDSDDEFDDFGRRKKHPKKAVGSTEDKEKSSVVDGGENVLQLDYSSHDDEEKEEEEEEEEEESGDEADLAKYNIGSSDEDGDTNDLATTDRSKDNVKEDSDSSEQSSDSSSESSSSSSSSSKSGRENRRSSRSASRSRSSSGSPTRIHDENNTNSGSPGYVARLRRGDAHERSRSPLASHS